MGDVIDYSALMQDAMRTLIRKVLEGVAKDGLPGKHHFFITLNTSHEGVEMSDWLREKYPESITIVMQNWFDDLEVGEDGFGITLSFNNQPEHLRIPYDAMTSFVDPSVEFGLRFETVEEGEEAVVLAPVEDEPDEAPMEENAEPEEKTEADVVSLDQFRK